MSATTASQETCHHVQQPPLPARRPEGENVIQASSLEHSAESLAAVFTTATNGAKSDGELRLDVLRWVLDLPPEIAPAQAAQILIGRQSRGESARFAESGQAMLVELGTFNRS